MTLHSITSSFPPSGKSVETARQAWGTPLPDWVAALARECDGSTQRAVADRLGRSAGLISQVLRRKYPGDMTAVEDAVRGAFLDATVICPALGNLPTDECQMWRKRARTGVRTNALRVRMINACQSCPLNKDPAK